MKIGIYDPYLDDLGGGEKYMMTAAESLSKTHQVTLFWDNKEDIKRVVDRFAIDLSRVTIAQNIFSEDIPTWKRMAATKKFDVIIVLSDGSIPLVLCKKLILHIQQPLNPLIGKNLKTKVKMVTVHSIFYNSNFSAHLNKKIFPTIKSVTIYPPVNFVGERREKENIILHVGRFRITNLKTSDYKKQQVMINAFKKMVDEGLKNWKFVVATSINDQNTPEFQAMLSSAKQYPIEFIINESNKTLREIYLKAKVYWHASGYGEDLQMHPELAEHFGISTVEAMRAGAVPVVINAGGQKEIVENRMNGYLWNTLDELKLRTNEIINNKTLLRKLSNQAIRDSKKFSKETFENAVNDLVKD